MSPPSPPPSPLPPLGSAEALDRLKLAKDPEAWRYVIEQHGLAMYRTCYAILRDHQLAEDAMQQACLYVRDGARHFRGEAKDRDAMARSWLRRVASSCALQSVRSQGNRRRREVQVGSSSVVSESALEDQLIQKEFADILSDELAEMPERYSQPLLLHYYADLGYEDLAKELHCSVPAARVRVHRSLKRLRKRLESRGVTTSLWVILLTTESISRLASDHVSVLGDGAPLLGRCQAYLFSNNQPAAAMASAMSGGLSIMPKLGVAFAGTCTLGLSLLGLSTVPSQEQNSGTQPVVAAEAKPAADFMDLDLAALRQRVLRAVNPDTPPPANAVSEQEQLRLHAMTLRVMLLTTRALKGQQELIAAHDLDYAKLQANAVHNVAYMQGLRKATVLRHGWADILYQTTRVLRCIQQQGAALGLESSLRDDLIDRWLRAHVGQNAAKLKAWSFQYGENLIFLQYRLLALSLESKTLDLDKSQSISRQSSYKELMRSYAGVMSAAMETYAEPARHSILLGQLQAWSDLLTWHVSLPEAQREELPASTWKQCMAWMQERHIDLSHYSKDVQTHVAHLYLLGARIWHGSGHQGARNRLIDQLLSSGHGFKNNAKLWATYWQGDNEGD